jgi:hypothetical protein
VAAISLNKKRALSLAVAVAAAVAIVVLTVRWMHTLTAKIDAVAARQDHVEELLTGPVSAGIAPSSSSGGLLKSSGTFAYPVGPITGTLGQGTYPAPAPASTITWGTAVTAPQLTQASESSATKGADMLFTAQQSTYSLGGQGGGNFVFNVQTPVTTGAEAGINLNRGGNDIAWLGGYPGAAPLVGLWLGNGTATPPITGAVFTLIGDGTSAYLNAPGSGGLLHLRVTDVDEMMLSSSVISMGLAVGGLAAVPFSWSTTAAAIACGTGGTQTITAAQAITPGLIVTSGTLSSNCTLDFSTNASTGYYVLDMTGVTLGATFGVVFKNGTTTKTYLSSSILSGTLAIVWTHGTNNLAVNF